MLSSEIRAIYFDAVGTLIYPEPTAAVVYAAVGWRHGSTYTPEAIGERCRAAFAREEALDLAGGLRTSEEREIRRWRHIVASVLDDVNDGDACFRELYEHFSRPEAWACDPEAGPVLERLAAGGYVLGMASNFDHRLRLVLAGKPELQPLERLVLSSEVGWRKPAPEFFAALCRSAGVPAATILYVGDDLANDYYGAQRLGLRAVLLDRAGRYAVAAQRRVGRLSEVNPAAVFNER